MQNGLIVCHIPAVLITESECIFAPSYPKCPLTLWLTTSFAVYHIPTPLGSLPLRAVRYPLTQILLPRSFNHFHGGCFPHAIAPQTGVSGARDYESPVQRPCKGRVQRPRKGRTRTKKDATNGRLGWNGFSEKKKYRVNGK